MQRLFRFWGWLTASALLCLTLQVDRVRAANGVQNDGSAAAPSATSLDVSLPEGRAPRADETIDEIRVKGNGRVEDDSILDRIATEEGDQFDRAQISRDIESIYALGYFRDIKVDATVTPDGTLVVTYVVTEKPAIRRIQYKGNSEVDTDEIKGVVDLKKHTVLDINQVKRNTEKIKDLYADEGYYLAEVDYQIKWNDNRTLASVIFEIREYQEVQVKTIEILGNEAIPDSELERIMRTREGGYFAFLTNSGKFKERTFQKDVKKITAYYYNEGYVQVNVGEPELRLSADKRYLHISIPLTEGKQYSVGNIEISGDLLFPKKRLRKEVLLESGQTFSYGDMRKATQAIQRMYQDKGYANVNVTPLTRLQRQQRTVDVNYSIEKGRKVKFRRIEITGNTKTRDQVIRRELEFAEGDQYSKTAIEDSKIAVKRLGYFKKVKFKTVSTDEPGYVDIRVEVKERRTGQLQIGAGYANTAGFTANARISQQNLLGRGQTLSLQAQISGIRQLFNLKFVEPWFLGSRWRFSFELFNLVLLRPDFSTRSTGGNVTLGYPISEAFDLDLPNNGDLIASGTYLLEDVDILPGGQSQRNFGSTSVFRRGGLTSSFALSLRYETLNNRIFPTAGQSHSVSAELADDTATLSDNEFVKYDAEARAYFPMFWEFVFKVSGELGYVASIDAETPVPYSERYFVGGPRTVRGFDRYALGAVRPVTTNEQDPASSMRDFQIGGNKQLIFTTEIQFPILKAARLNGVFFGDMGNAFDAGQQYSIVPDVATSPDKGYRDALRTSVGFGFRWHSPIAPLRFEWGIPLSRLRGEKPVVFEFSFGRGF